MINKIRALVKKNKSILIYVFFGIITTIVNYLVYLPLYNYFHIPAAICNIAAWLVAVIVAFLTNKSFVFNSHDWSLRIVTAELVKFFGSRLASGLFETVTIFLAVDIIGWNGNVWKIITSVLVIVINYIASKFFVFTQK